MALTKPEVNFLIVIATFTGFYLGYPGDLHNFPLGRLLNALCGTLLVASGTGTLNQYLEHHFDAQMRRTRRRPVAAGRLRPATAAWFGMSLSFVGAVYLFVTVNALASALALFTLATYLLIYTPLKRKTPLCTLVGAVPGAMPPLIGWAAASGSIVERQSLDPIRRAVPLAVPSLHGDRVDVSRGLRSSRLLDIPNGKRGPFFELDDRLHQLSRSLPLPWLQWVPEGGGLFQYSATVLLASGLLYYAIRQTLMHSRIAARQLLKASIIYLPLQFLILLLRKG